jgi:hypothetical protein
MLLDGLRSCEILTLQLEDLKLPDAQLHVLGKGRKQRTLPLPGEIMEVLQSYLRLERPLTNSPSLFVSLKGRRRGQPMTPAGLRSLFRHHRLRSEVPAANPHRFSPLTEDVIFAGSLKPSLFVSTTGTDSDWVVKLIDVYPDTYPDPDPNPTDVKMGGYQQLVRGELMRGRFRRSYEKPDPFVPGKMDKVEYGMPDVCHSFRKRHRIMVQVQSSWFPLVDRNPQRFVDIYNAKADDFQKATQRVYRSRTAPSAVHVTVLK